MKNKLILTLLFSLTLLGACTPTINQRGNLLENYQIDQVVPGVHTKSDALRILGSPTAKSTFDENTWYYIGQETEKHGILDPQITAERIVIVEFDKDGVVQGIGDADAHRLDIPFERSKTPTHGNEMTVMQQLLGNLGRFNPQE